MSDNSVSLATERIIRKQTARDSVKKLVQIAIENQEPYIVGNIAIMQVTAETLMLAAVFEALEEQGFKLVSHSHLIVGQEPIPDAPGRFCPRLHISFVCRTVDGKPKTVLLHSIS